jgi:GntR family transcriptional repressor for pyruvate dehydrogenase complex
VLPNKSDSSSLSEHVAQHLIEYIRANQLKSGDAVPSQMRISADLGVSRGIVREAFRALAMAGIIEINGGRSPWVGRINDEGIAIFVRHALSTDQITMKQVLDLRAAIEIRGAELAATNGTPEHAARLFEEVAKMTATREERDRFVEADLRFHEVIEVATGNPLYELAGCALRSSMKASIRAGLENRTTRGEINRIVARHRQIARAISNRDASAPREKMWLHFRDSLNSFAALRGRFVT